MDQRNVPAIAYRLWNPRAAAAWGFLLTPLGACLHAINWREIGEPQRARANLIWMWSVIAAVLAATAAAIFLPENRLIDAITRVSGTLLWLSWFWSQGRVQMQYVKSLGEGNYIKKGWARPLLASLLALGLYVAFVFALAFAQVYATQLRFPETRDPVELAAWVETRILKKWQEKPVLRDATIQKIDLSTKDRITYTGPVDATIEGKPERLQLELIVEGDNAGWHFVKKTPDPSKGR